MGMLESLRITNYALIDDLAIDFSPGLNIFTGSTGAGKTIIIGALGLALGERASEDSIRTGAKNSSVEAVFSISNKSDEFRRLEVAGELIDDNERLIIRREVNRDGRSRAFVNNRQVTIQNLKSVGINLADITSQRHHKSLLDPNTHRLILDGYAGLQGELGELAEIYKKYNRLKLELENVKKKQDESIAEKELLEFQIKEIELSSLTEGEDDKLEQEKFRLINAEKIKTACHLCQDILFDDDSSVSSRLNITLKELEHILKFSKQVEIIKNEIDEFAINLEEISTMLRDLSDSIEFDPARLEIIEDRIAHIKKLKRKYGQTIGEILQYCQKAKGRAAGYENLDGLMKKLNADYKSCRDELSTRAEYLSQKRKKAALEMEKEIIKHLSDLAMQNSDFKVQFDIKEDMDGPFMVGSRSVAGDDSGFDKVEFLICANPGEQLKPLASTASGGELSRVLLAVCSVLSDILPRDTLVFDEIDSGISGEVATQVGKKLKMLAKKRQVICITHLQQIASHGVTHFKVYKGKSKKRSVTRVKRLSGDQRVAEIARLLAGEKISDVALDGASQLLEEGRS
jgi:DNA repair protein RecN (Recombination protein N)